VTLTRYQEASRLTGPIGDTHTLDVSSGIHALRFVDGNYLHIGNINVDFGIFGESVQLL
jgi:hypothetical protein